MAARAFVLSLAGQSARCCAHLCNFCCRGAPHAVQRLWLTTFVPPSPSPRPAHPDFGGLALISFRRGFPGLLPWARQGSPNGWLASPCYRKATARRLPRRCIWQQCATAAGWQATRSSLTSVRSGSRGGACSVLRNGPHLLMGPPTYLLVPSGLWRDRARAWPLEPLC